MKLTNLQFNGEARRLIRRWLRLCLPAGLTVTVLAGCAQQRKVAEDINPVGAYALVSVDGKNVPCVVDHEGHSITVKSGTFDIKADGTCVSKVAFAVPSGGDVSRDVEATYSRTGAKLVMQWKGAGTTTGTVDGDTFTMNNEGMVFAYRK